MNREDMFNRLKAGEDALELSIKKWQDIIDGKGQERGTANCALCEKYMKHDYEEPDCSACLVYKDTDKHTCDGTPYEGFIKHFNRCDDCSVLNTPMYCAKGIECAKDERDFLISLRQYYVTRVEE